MLIGRIPGSIGKLSKMKQFYVQTNRIVGQIPSSFGNITGLIVLSLGENLLEGNIPTSLGNCIYLEELYLSLNHLNGMIPKEVIGLSSITRGLLWLTSNNLTEPLPTEVGNCRNIILLDVSRNKLYGEILSSLANCLLLEERSLQGNSFEGTIPSSLRKLRSLQVLDLSNNNLSGQIPEVLGELPLLMNLNLSFNSFEGKMPTKGVFDNISAFSVLGNNKLYGGIKPLSLPACPTEIAKKGKNFLRRAIIAIIIVCFTVLFLACLFAISQRVCSSKSKEGFASPLEDKYPKLSYVELLQATEVFSLTNLIGKGRYGSVYKGILSSDAQTVAVKVHNLLQCGADRSFKAECEVLRNLRHRNLVKVITSCSSIDFQGNDLALVFDFMPNGSLESWLDIHPSSIEQQNARSLNLVQRLNIAIGIASALDYLLSQFDKPVIHCDLKPSNVLLYSDLTAQVTDFGLAKFLSMNTDEPINEQSCSIGIRGTVGYIPPEYGMGSEISTAGDVYSYGVLLMELFTGKSPTGSLFTGEMSLHDYVKRALLDHLVEIVDPKLILKDGDFNQTDESSSKGMSIGNVWKRLASVLDIGVICSAALPGDRMNIRDVLTELHSVRNILLEVEDHRRKRD